jgi:hypothetical protein
MITSTRPAGLVRRFNRKTLAVVLCILIVAAIAARGTGATTPPAAGSGLPQTHAAVGSAGSDAAGTTATTDGAAAPSDYMPSVDDLTGNTVIYDDGTSDQMDYVPAFDPGS